MISGHSVLYYFSTSALKVANLHHRHHNPLTLKPVLLDVQEILLLDVATGIIHMPCGLANKEVFLNIFPCKMAPAKFYAHCYFCMLYCSCGVFSIQYMY